MAALALGVLRMIVWPYILASNSQFISADML